MQLVLGSTSPFRADLLRRLGVEFTTDAPDIDESRQPGESPRELVMRLSAAKAATVGERHPDSLVIGSDQVACIDDQVLGKPGDRVRAIAQLEQAAGRAVRFETGLTLLNTASMHAQTVCEPFTVHFRDLDLARIERYVDAEEPFNCAGSFKSEGLGISLFSRLEGDDPNALVGLPLIRLVDMLAQEGIQVP